MYQRKSGKPFEPRSLPDMPLTASDIKQFVYCPRMVFFKYVLPVPTLPTYKMKIGVEAHKDMNRKERRRTTKKYKLSDGERSYQQFFKSDRLSLSGKLDLLIENSGHFYPVEYKNSTGVPGLHHRYQLTAYALLVEDTWNTVVRRGFIYMLDDDIVYPLEITEGRKRFLKALLNSMRSMVAMESIPRPTPFRERCIECEFKLYCADTV
jgi:CRISPR-associated exonuclease Cas4